MSNPGVEDVMLMVVKYGTLCASLTSLTYGPDTPFIATLKQQTEEKQRALFGQIQDALERIAG